AQWHKTRAKIGCHDDAHPGFDPQAHEARKQRLRRIEIEEAEKIRTSLPSADKDDIMMREISPLEIAAMLAASSNGTAPGTDQLPYELLTNGGEAVRTTLLLVYNLGWFAGLHPSPWDLALVRPLFKAKTKEPLVIANYRAVSLINCICKGYETVLFNRTSAHLESRKDISPGQGARRHMGTEELLYTITSTAKARYAHSGKGTYVCFIDFTLAYPSTDHNVIFTKMRDKGITGRLWANIRHLYRNMQSRVMHPDISQDEFFKIVSGVREGSVLSPILFIIAVDDMLEYLKARPFRSKDHHSSNRSPD
ncbi:MAG: reverse transcriptase domain-containing protein, partial [Promethearchaeia archaeon]